MLCNYSVVVYFASQLIIIRLTEKYDGKYLAKEIVDCVKRFGLKNHVC